MRAIAITGATVLVGRELEPITDATVVIDGDTITTVGNESVAIPHGANEIDLAGHVLAPGFIDAHVHIGFYDPHEVLAGGVTTVRDLAWPPEEIFELVGQSDDDNFEGPAILAAGPMLTAPGGYPARASWAPPGTALELHDATSAQRAVDDLAPRAAIIKIALNPQAGPVLDHDVLRAIVDAAHGRGLRVTGHVEGLEQLRRAIDVGVDELAHMLMGREPIPPSMIAEMVESEMTVVPTLSIRTGRDRDVAIDNLDRFRTAGGTIVYGTDLGNEGPRPGIDPLEVDAMAEAGMSVVDIVRSATEGAASYLGLADVGVIAPGMKADLVAFRGEVAEGHRLLRRVARVWKRGRLVT
ncbi:MAG: amidohydrolase family protein [Actinomycetota bacterium]|nr:amidohydrolase family protein [Actinomycetota bacterium]